MREHTHSRLIPNVVPDAPRRLLSDPLNRVMTRADCEALFKRIVALASGGGDTQVTIRGTWTANLRWARNRPTTSGDTIAFTAQITRTQPGKQVTTELDRLDDTTLKQAVQSLEQRLATLRVDRRSPPELLGPQTYLTPTIWDDATFTMTPKDLSEAVRISVDPVVDAKLDAAGYAELSAATWAIFNTKGLAAHAMATGALYTETVRNMEGDASGWAGKSHTAWAKLGVSALSATALQKCRDSAHPVKIEPGRYTAILEPKAVAALMYQAVAVMDRNQAETGKTVYTDTPPQNGQRGTTKIGQQVFDKHITVTSDPTDPDGAYIPFDPAGEPYRKVTWVEHGILKALPYSRAYARRYLGTDEALPNPLAFRMSGGSTPIEEMIASTERGVYVTHFSLVNLEDWTSLSDVSVTRDGIWLIEHGKIVHPIKNFWIYDSPMIIFNQVEAIGPAVRTVGICRVSYDGSHVRSLPTQALNDGNLPIIAPPMQVKDFNFTRLSEAI